jgi:hypothetical protein
MYEDLDAPAPRPADRRRDHRPQLIIELFFEGTDATGVASTRDISAGGLYMNTLAALPEGAAVLLRIPLGAVQLVVEARVVYSNPGRGVGLHFCGLTQEAREALEQACADWRLAA